MPSILLNNYQSFEKLEAMGVPYKNIQRPLKVRRSIRHSQLAFHWLNSCAKPSL
jgi:hypothetical protein